jgi:TPR repeat protein
MSELGIQNDPRFQKAVATLESGNCAGALFLFRSLAEDGFKFAYSRVGLINEVGGPGLSPNYDEALKWYRKSYFETADLNARIGLGRMYYLGTGVQIDYSEALKYLTEAMPNHISNVYYMLGMMYFRGNGVLKNPQKARAMFMRGAAKGSLPSLALVGLMDRHLGRSLRGRCLQYRTAIRAFGIAIRNPNDERLTTV